MRKLTKKDSSRLTNSVFLSNSPEETEKIGEELGKNLEKGSVIALYAALGAGKTVFAKGIARALGVEDIVQSPTYTIINEYEGEKLDFYHIDAYRLNSSADFIDIGGEEIIFGEGVSLIEWSERIDDILGDALSGKLIKIKIMILDGNKREIKIENLR